MSLNENLDWRAVLVELSHQPFLHAKFLNSLSLLEYIGARKIVKSQPKERVTSDLLGHIAEEVRHARVFKGLALKLSKGELVSYTSEHTLCLKETVNYIEEIDRKVEHVLSFPDHWMNYLGTTLLIEERANEVYPFYDSILSEIGFKNVLRGIVLEEKSHLEDVRKSLNRESKITEDGWRELRSFEERCFYHFMNAVSRELRRTGLRVKDQSSERSRSFKIEVS